MFFGTKMTLVIFIIFQSKIKNCKITEFQLYFSYFFKDENFFAGQYAVPDF